MARLTSDQKALLIQRIDALYGYSVREKAARSAVLPDTAEVAEARKLVAEFDKKNNARHKAVIDKYVAASSKAREVLYFASPTDALATIKAMKPIKP